MNDFEATENGVLTITRDGVVVSQIEVKAGSTTSFVGDYTFEAGATIPEPDESEE